MKRLMLLGLLCVTALSSGCIDLFSPPKEVYTLYFEWDYAGSRWEWDLEVPKNLFKQYKQDKERHTCSCAYCDWRKYVLDTADDTLVEELTTTLQNAMDKEFGTDPELRYRVLEFALNFVTAAIPYTVDTQRDEWPRYPLETLVEERGDCEDTSILYASLVRTFGYGAHLLLLPGHVAVGVPVDQWYINSREYQVGYYSYSGQYYVYAETTGDPPGYWRLGELPASQHTLWTDGQWCFFDVASGGLAPLEPMIHAPDSLQDEKTEGDDRSAPAQFTPHTTSVLRF